MVLPTAYIRSSCTGWMLALFALRRLLMLSIIASRFCFAGWHEIGGTGRPFPEGGWWGHQVAVMFQIVCALVLEVPSVLLELESLNGLTPNVILACEPWGHVDHGGEGCESLSSDSTGAYVHDLSLTPVGTTPPL